MEHYKKGFSNIQIETLDYDLFNGEYIIKVTPHGFLVLAETKRKKVDDTGNEYVELTLQMFENSLCVKRSYYGYYTKGFMNRPGDQDESFVIELLKKAEKDYLWSPGCTIC